MRFLVGHHYSTGLYRVSVIADCEQEEEGEWAKYTFIDDAFKGLFDDVAIDMYTKDIGARNSNFREEGRGSSGSRGWRLKRGKHNEAENMNRKPGT
jgi:hypothetical protein